MNKAFLKIGRGMLGVAVYCPLHDSLFQFLLAPLSIHSDFLLWVWRILLTRLRNLVFWHYNRQPICSCTLLRDWNLGCCTQLNQGKAYTFRTFTDSSHVHTGAISGGIEEGKLQWKISLAACATLSTPYWAGATPSNSLWIEEFSLWVLDCMGPRMDPPTTQLRSSLNKVLVLSWPLLSVISLLMDLATHFMSSSIFRSR